MNGIDIVTNEHGSATSILIDMNVLRKHSVSGREVVDYLTSLEDLEDIIDVEMSRSEPSIPWDVAKQQLKNSGNLSAYV